VVLSGVAFCRRLAMDATKALACAWGRHPRAATIIALAGVVIGAGAAVALIGVRSAPAAVQESSEAEVSPLARQDSMLVRSIFDWSRFPPMEADSASALPTQQRPALLAMFGPRHPVEPEPAPPVIAAPKTKKGGHKLSGLASFYRLAGYKTANGETFDPNLLTAAHRTLPFGTKLRVTNEKTGKSVIVRVNDRGPFIPGRELDLSYSAAESLGMVEQGVTKVQMTVVQ
jgi:rare lipoprotein A (peptidoglycan hydrolase)